MDAYIRVKQETLHEEQLLWALLLAVGMVAGLQHRALCSQPDRLLERLF